MTQRRTIRKTVFFSGMVQGVGFRFTACRVAGGFDVTGCVRNLPDGRVECVAEGPADQVEAFLAELSSQMAGHIRHTAGHTAPATGRWKSFGVAY